MSDIEKLFSSVVVDLQALIDKRKGSWKLTSIMEFDDVRSILLAHLWNNFSRYDRTKPLDRWANTVISNALKNLLRQNCYKNARPCIAATSYGNPCAYARGCDGCAWTKSGKQDSSCGFYKAWLDKKQAKFAVATPLSIENHIDESHSIQSDFVDIEGAKKVIDDKIIGKLNEEEAKVYHLLYIEHMDLKEVGKKMRYKKQKNSDVPGYLVLRTIQLRIKELARVIIEEQNLA